MDCKPDAAVIAKESAWSIATPACKASWLPSETWPKRVFSNNLAKKKLKLPVVHGSLVVVFSVALGSRVSSIAATVELLPSMDAKNVYRFSLVSSKAFCRFNPGFPDVPTHVNCAQEQVDSERPFKPTP